MKEVILDCGDLKVEFLFGNLVLTYREIHLSKELGLYSSIYYNNHWHDSRYGHWRIVENKKNKKVIYGEWVNLAHRQTWLLESPSYNTLQWSIKCENFDEPQIEMIQQNYMLSDLYVKWKVEGYAEGRFPEYFANYKGLLWDRIWSMPERKDIKIFLSGEKTKINIPTIVWEALSSRYDTLMVIENTSPKFSARVLQLLYVNYNRQNLTNFPLILHSKIKVNDETD